MRAASLSFSATLPLPKPVNSSLRCASVSWSPTVIKSRLCPTRRRRLSTGNRSVPSFSEVQTESGNLQSAAIPTSVPVRVAHELLQAGHHYLDVRTTEEFSAGHVDGAVNVPFLLKFGPGMTKNPQFVEQVLNHFGRYDEIIVGCQLGTTSVVAASELWSAGFTGLTNMAGGYAAWAQNKLPSTE